MKIKGKEEEKEFQLVSIYRRSTLLMPLACMQENAA